MLQKFRTFNTSDKWVFLVFGVVNVPNIWHLAHLPHLLWMLLGGIEVHMGESKVFERSTNGSLTDRAKSDVDSHVSDG